MPFWYNNQHWQPWPTVEDGDSFFHAVFGKYQGNLQFCFDPLARVRRMQWSTFLTYFENKTRPISLQEQIETCLVAHLKMPHSVDIFSRYIDDVLLSEHRVLIAELPILTTLENIRVVLFVGDTEIPLIFEPHVELLGNYPLENVTPLKESVICLRTNNFLRLRPTVYLPDELASADRAEGTTQALYEDRMEYFRKLRDFSVGGILYEINILTIVLTNALRQFSRWRLAANMADADEFHDLVFEVLPSRETTLVRVLFRTASFTEITLDSMIGDDLKGHADFLLAKYYFSYHKIKSIYKVENVIICTNIDFNMKVKREFVDREELKEDSIFQFEGVKSVCYTLNKNIINMLHRALERYPFADKVIISAGNIREFLEHFRIITLYPSKNNFDQAIETIMSSLEYCDHSDSKDYARHINNEIVNWLDETSGRYLTEIDAKAYFCELRSNKYREKLRSIKIKFKSDRLALDNAKKIHHIVPHNESTLTLIKVDQFLQNNRVSELFVNPSDSVYIQKQTIEAFEAPNYTHLVMSVITKNERVIQQMCDKIIRILNTYVHKRVILVAGKDNEFIRRLTIECQDLYEKLDDHITLDHLTEQSQEVLLEEVVTLFEVNM